MTEPITITWWHAHEDQLTEYLNYRDKFNTENEMGITVEPVYIGSYDEINTQFIAAAAAGTGTVPALVTCNTSYPASYGKDGLCARCWIPTSTPMTTTWKTSARA